MSLVSIEDPEGNIYSYDGNDILFNGETFLHDTSLLTLTAANSELQGIFALEFSGTEAGEFEYIQGGDGDHITFKYTTRYGDDHINSGELNLDVEGVRSDHNTASVITNLEHVHADASLTAAEILSDSGLLLSEHEKAHGEELIHLDSLNAGDLLDLGNTNLEGMGNGSSTTGSRPAVDQTDLQKGGVSVYTQDNDVDIPSDTTPLA